MIDKRGADRRKAIDELRDQHAPAMRELLAPKPVDRKAQEMGLVFLARSDTGVPAGMRRGPADAT